jgi:hypothetical protein
MNQSVSRKLNFNPGNLQEGEWVLVVNNHFNWSLIYLFSLVIKLYQLVWLRLTESWQEQHALRVMNGITREQLGSGCNEVPVGEWLPRANRTVDVYQYEEAFAEVAKKGYGFFDIPQIFLHGIRRKLSIGHAWNGTDGIPPRFAGWFCSEEVGMAIRHRLSHHLFPGEIRYIKTLRYVGSFQTVKGEVVSWERQYA